MSKNCKKEALNALRYEAELLEKFNHPNIVLFKYFKEYYNFYVLGLEWWSEGSLLDWVSKKTKEM